MIGFAFIINMLSFYLLRSAMSRHYGPPGRFCFSFRRVLGLRMGAAICAAISAGLCIVELEFGIGVTAYLGISGCSVLLLTFSMPFLTKLVSTNLLCRRFFEEQ